MRHCSRSAAVRRPLTEQEAASLAANWELRGVERAARTRAPSARARARPYRGRGDAALLSVLELGAMS